MKNLNREKEFIYSKYPYLKNPIEGDNPIVDFELNNLCSLFKEYTNKIYHENNILKSNHKISLDENKYLKQKLLKISDQLDMCKLAHQEDINLFKEHTTQQTTSQTKRISELELIVHEKGAALMLEHRENVTLTKKVNELEEENYKLRCEINKGREEHENDYNNILILDNKIKESKEAFIQIWKLNPNSTTQIICDAAIYSLNKTE